MMKLRTMVLTAAAAVLTLAAVSCGKKDKEEAVSIDGCWELTKVEQTKAAHVGDVTVDVYVQFEQGAFVLYQRIGDGRYSRFEGSYLLGKNKELTGTYAGGKAWGPYTFVLSETDLVLTKGSEKDTYKKVSSIPEKVLSNVY